MAVKYLSGNRLWGTDAERLALTTISATTYTGDMSTGWTQTGSEGADFTIDGTYDEIDLLENSSTTPPYNAKNVRWDSSTVATLSTTAWVVRFAYQNTGTASDDNPVWWVGFSTDSTVASNATDQDFVGFGTQALQSTQVLAPYIYATDNERLDQANIASARLQLDSSNVDLVKDNRKYYVEIIRDGTDFTVNVYSDSSFSTLLCTKTTAFAAIGTIRYFIIANYIQGSGVTGTFSEFKWWNGTTDPSSYPNLPNGSVFITSDTNVHYMWNGTDTWNEVA